MGMVKKSISVTDKQNSWIKSQMETGDFGNESEVLRELIRERQIREQENSQNIAMIRERLIKAEKSGFTHQSSTEILKEIKNDLSNNDTV